MTERIETHKLQMQRQEQAELLFRRKRTQIVTSSLNIMYK